MQNSKMKAPVVYIIIIYFHIFKCLITNAKMALKSSMIVPQLTQFDSERCYLGL